MLLMVVGEIISGLVNGLPGLSTELYQCLGGCRVHLMLFVIVEGVQGIVWWVVGFIGFVQWFVWFA